MHLDLNTAVGIFNNPHEAESAFNELEKTGYDMRKLSMIGGLLIGWIVSILAINGLLAKIGVPKASIDQYENALKSNKFILIVQGTLPEVEKATDILIHNRALHANYHKSVIEKHPEMV